LETPRDRQASFDPKIVAKGQTRWTGFDDKIISMYARGMTTREIQGHLEEIYGIEVSPTLISNVTDAVIEEVKLWQGRPLEELYPLVYLDALMVKVRDEGHIQNKAIYVVLGVNLEGQREVLGLWVAQTEGGKFWLQVLTELQNRGVKDILIACVESLSQREPGVAAQLGADHTLFPLPTGHPSRHLHHQRGGIAEPIATQNHQDPWWIPQRGSGAEAVVSGAAAGGQEVDNADSSLAGSLEPLHHSVAGTNAGPGTGGGMKAQNPSTSLGEGSDTAPSLAHPSQKQNLVVYTEDLTHLSLSLQNMRCFSVCSDNLLISSWDAHPACPIATTLSCA
jgi:hypothetical protein